MSKLYVSRRVPASYDRQTFEKITRDVEEKVNKLAEGVLDGTHNAHTAAPTGTSQSYAVGDFIRNSSPSELGSVGSKYVLLGWVCVTSGAPGTWRECRVLTGN